MYYNAVTKPQNSIMNKLTLVYAFVLLTAAGCKERPSSSDASMIGTWRLLTATLIENGDTTVTDYTTERSFIKIINATHFAFLMHTTGTDSAAFSAGGGTYRFDGKTYTELLEYCNAKEWEGQKFLFNIERKGDTLIQSGIEKIEAAGIDRLNIERYVRYSSEDER